MHGTVSSVTRYTVINAVLVFRVLLLVGERRGEALAIFIYSSPVQTTNSQLKLNLKHLGNDLMSIFFHCQLSGSIMFHVRRRPADSQPRRRKKKPLGVSNGGHNVSTDREGPVLVEITHSGEGGRSVKLTAEPIEVSVSMCVFVCVCVSVNRFEGKSSWPVNRLSPEWIPMI